MSYTQEQYLPSIVPYLLEVVTESEVVFEEEEEEEEEEGDGEDGSGSVGGGFKVTVEEGYVNSKKAALDALGAMATHSGVAFAPQVLTYVG
jgi:hypothetical protein